MTYVAIMLWNSVTTCRIYVTTIAASLVEDRELEKLLETIMQKIRLFFSDRIVKTLLVCVKYRV